MSENVREQSIDSFAEFSRRNDIKVNKIIFWIIVSLNAVGPLVALGRGLNFFRHVEYSYCILASVFAGAFSLIMFILNKDPKHYKCAKYFGLISVGLFALLLGREATLGVYLSYAVVSFLSTMYYDRRATCIVSGVGYVFMVLALILRAEKYCEIYDVTTDPMHWIVGHISSFTLEYIFVFLVSYAMVTRTRKSFQKLYYLNQQAKAFQHEITVGFANLVECRDNETGEHIKSTSDYVRIIAEKMREKDYYSDELTDYNIKLFEETAPLHDLGKILIPDAILNKPGKLTDEEFEIIKTHTIEGKRLIDDNIKSVANKDFIKVAEDMAYCHHEKWDGSGYPQGISGTEIPLCARIMAVADVFDALLSKRPYKEAFTKEQSLAIIRQSSGTHFEPCIVECLMELKDEIQH